MKRAVKEFLEEVLEDSSLLLLFSDKDLIPELVTFPSCKQEHFC